MMTSAEIRKILKDTWPDLTQIWLTDPAYEPIPKEWLDIVLKECRVEETYKDNVWDCDNYALSFHCCVQRFQYGLVKAGEIDTKFSWAVGECIGKKAGIFGSVTHSMNIAVTDTGVVLIEPQEGTIKKSGYTPFFVKF